ncbi:hypothetical protein EV700_3075 [Fluviicoccus keumensis]|uniref:DnaK suppressor protein-like N-terminal domain-containing protein n=1 Tax=Fluviicoccus keumensis TaxID=1435465 RepID=A0A4Q7YH82_9GAMM|nr:hypothetical protein [Fluviicoccus keumensis]RZU36862.1 hypothetical protein EV700_3075 [Fluviicoccus keumensis]
MTDLVARRAELSARRTELLTRLAAIRQDYANGLPADFEEQAQQLENSEVLQEISRLAAEELGQVEAALVRIEQALGNLKA